MNAQHRDALIRAALRPADDVRAPSDLGASIHQEILGTPQRPVGALWPRRWTSTPAGAGLWFILLALLLVGLAIAIGSRPPEPRSLPLSVAMYHGNAERTGVMPGPGPAGMVTIGWQSSRSGPISFSLMPVVGDGTVYVGDGSGAVAALDEKTGAERWIRVLASPITASPLLLNGLAVVGTEDGTVAAMDAANGDLRWQFRAGAAVRASLVVAGGTLFVGTDGGDVIALDPSTGARLWTLPVGGAVTRGPAVSRGVMYVGAGGGRFSAIDLSTRAAVWAKEFGPGELATPSVSDAAVYTTTGLRADGVAHRLIALSVVDGLERWAFEAPSAEPLYVGGVGDGFVFAVGEDFNVYALDAETGMLRWTFATDGIVGSLAALVDGVLYVSSADQTVYAIDVGTGAQRWRLAVEGTPTIPVVINGQVIVGTDLGLVVAIVGSEPPPSP